MRVSLIQHDIVWEDRERTFERVEPLVARAVADGAELVVLPEMFATGFSMSTDVTAEPADGTTDLWLAELARRHSVHLVGTRVEIPNPASGPDPQRGAARPHNTAVLLDPNGDRIARYAKRHPISLMSEDRAHSAGDGPVVVSCLGARVALVICYDLRFPEDFREATLEHDAEVFLVVANWPTARGAHWDLLLRARAVENLAWVVGVNRVGTGGGIDFDGRSQIVHPLGEVLAREPSVETVITRDIDPEEARGPRARLGFLEDARTARRAPS